MKIFATIVLIASLAASLPAAGPVSEDIHSLANGPVKLCNLEAETIGELEARAIALPGAQELQGSSSYRAVVTNEDSVLTFTRPSNRAHPSAACRRIFVDDDGSVSVSMEIRCDNSRENCDWLYGEFKALNAQISESMKLSR